MSALPVQLPLEPERSELLARLVSGLDPSALQWLSGYLAGAAARGAPLAAAAAMPAPPAPIEEGPASSAAPPTATVLYGTQTGNSRALARRLHEALTRAGHAARLVRASDYRTRELASEHVLYVVISTQGDGDPPDDARGFCEHVLGARAPRLPRLRFAVLGLGDSSYPRFCEIGRALDARLAELGGTRLVPRGDCDVDVERVAGPWLGGALEAGAPHLAPPAGGPVSPLPVPAPKPLRVVPAPARHGREATFDAEVLASVRITGEGAEKEVRHLELRLPEGVTYEPGDALGIWPHNPPAAVEEVLDLLHTSPLQVVAHDGRTLPLSVWLGEELEITRVTRPFLEAHALRGGHIPGDAAEILRTHQLGDVLRRFPATWTASELVRALRPLAPRLYSIASSRRVVGDEVHLTVSVVDYEAFGVRHLGCASSYLARPELRTVRAFVESNDRFRLPADPARDVILIGPGTGVAPFRAFVQERAETGAQGRTWLFFGEQHFRTQFLYQVEWQQALKTGALTRLSTAFSRDQDHKIYVQHRLREEGEQVWSWLEGGASLYVCGDALRMAGDVEAALVEVIRKHGGRDGAAFLAGLREEGRYLRDVY